MVWACVAKRRYEKNWVKKCMEYEVEGSGPRGRKRTWREVVEMDCKARKLNKKVAMDRRWRKLINDV